MATLHIPPMPQTLVAAQDEIRVCRTLLEGFVANLKENGEWPEGWLPSFVREVEARLTEEKQ